MNYLEFSTEDVEAKTEELYQKIIDNNFDYDLVVFLARGSYTIGAKLADLNEVPLLEISAKRKGGGLKKILKPFLRCVPKSILIKMRQKEMNSTYHETNSDRNVSYSKINFEKYKDSKNILLVDDSIDSGNSIVEAKKKLVEIFKNSDIRVAVFNTMNKSTIKPEFTLYNDFMICGPWSSDSKYHKSFIKEYEEWKNEYEREN